MDKKRVFAIIGLAILILAIPVTLFLVRQVQIFKPRADFIPKAEFINSNGEKINTTNSPVVRLKIVKVASVLPSITPSVSPSLPPINPLVEIDILDFFLTKHPDKGLDGAHQTGSFTDSINGHAMNQKITGQSAYYTKWDSSVFEKFTWDGNFIYLKEDHSGAPVNFYSFNPGAWLKRFMKVGEKVSGADNNITWYDSSCRQTSTEIFPVEITFEQYIPDYDIAGDLGKQEVIVVKYDSGSLYEKFYYSRQWGWIRWEEYNKGTNQLLNRRTFNKIINSPIQPNTAAACTN